MKNYILLFLLSVFSLGYAQKEMQPFTLTMKKGEKKEINIMIFATASEVNEVVFTLKDLKGNPYLNKAEDEIQFKVTPFREDVFIGLLTDNIESIIAIKNGEEEPVKIDSKIVVEKEDARGVYQFFNALIITAFQYDTEPVAGELLYTLKTRITKKSLEGIDTEYYFNKQAKFLRKYVYVVVGEQNSLGKYKHIKVDDFINWVLNDPDEMKNMIQFYYDSKKRNSHKAHAKIKRHLRKKLKNLYNVYMFNEIRNFAFIKDYTSLNYDKKKLHKKLQSLDKQLKVKRDFIIKENSKIFKDDSLLNKLRSGKRSLKEELYRIERDRIYPIEEKIYEETNYSIYKLLELKRNHLKTLLDKNQLDKYDQLKKKLDEIEKDSIKPHVERLNNLNGEIYVLRKRLEGPNKEIKKLETELELKEQEFAQFQNDMNKKEKQIERFILGNRSQIYKHLAQFPLWNLNLDKIELDINDGFIEHITVVGKINDPDSGDLLDNSELLKEFFDEPAVKKILDGSFNKEIKFINEYPIGFSSKTDFADLHNYNLYSFRGNEKTFTLPLTDVILEYVQHHQNDRLDFSPKDQVVKLPTQDIGLDGRIELKKETSAKILNANFYSDFIGFQEKEANGQVQIEVEKFVPLWTKRSRLGIGRSSNFGLFNYANFNVTWYKLGEKNKQLQVEYTPDFVNDPNRYTTYLDLIRYENRSAGVDVNLGSFEMPLIKTRIEINAGIHFSRAKVIDSLPDSNATLPTKSFSKNVNFIRYYPDIIVRIRPEERFGGYLRFRPFKMVVPNESEFFSVSSERVFLETSRVKKNWMHRMELSTFYTPSAQSDNKFFFRYRYTNDSNWETNGFSEFQVGYLAYLKF